MSLYTIGLDYGSLSGRAVLADVANGHVVATSVFEYPHAVMTCELPDGTPLAPDFALQHPQDYLDVLMHTIPAVLRESGVSKEDIIGIGVDFTSSTVMPVDASGTPFCMIDAYRSEPHAYVKLWKHHAAQEKANIMTEIAAARNEGWLNNYGGKVSSEWSFPKLWEVLEEAPHIYNAMDEWMEAGDWIVLQLTGKRTRNACAAGYKNFWNKKTGYPDKAFFAACDKRLENVIEEKLRTPVTPLGTCAGYLTEEMAEKLGLKAGISVGVSHIDAHVCIPAVGMTKPGQMLAIMGTSTCHMSLSDVERQAQGICGVVEDGILPGFFGYEAGQSCVGDHFAWLVDHMTPASYFAAARAQGKHIQQYLTELADKLRPGESGLLALDWWNGNRSVLVDFDLSGLILGMTLQTRTEEIYRALIEATAYGARMIVETYRECGMQVNEFFASGGISQKNKMAMQIYADVLNMPVHISGAEQGPALGSAIFGAVAAGAENGGYDDVYTAIQAMAQPDSKVYLPIQENVCVYEQLFGEYRKLHDYFGRGENDVMKRLKVLKNAR